MSIRTGSPYASDEDTPAPSPCIGTVRLWLDAKGFGWITHAGGDAFVHHSAIQNSGGRRSLKEGAQVRFTLVQRERGMAALDVQMIG